MKPFEKPGNVWLRSEHRNTFLSADRWFSQDLSQLLDQEYNDHPVVSTTHQLDRATRPHMYAFNLEGDAYEAFEHLNVLADEKHWYDGSEPAVKEKIGSFIRLYRERCLQSLLTERSEAGFAAFADYLHKNWMPMIRGGEFTPVYDEILEVVDRSHVKDIPGVAQELPAYNEDWTDPMQTEYQLIQLGKIITSQPHATCPREQQILPVIKELE